MEATTGGVLATWAAWQKAQNLSARTITERAGVIRHLLATTGRGPLDLTAEDIIVYITRDGITDTSRATYAASIRAYCRWLVRTHRRPDDPTTEIPQPRRKAGRPRPVREEQLEAMLLAANRHRTRAFILLAALAGLRVHEIAKIRGEDVDLEAAALFVRGKGGKEAWLPLHPVLLDLAHAFPARGWWFPAYDGCDRPVHPCAVGTAIHRAMDRAGVDATPHQLRHYYGTTLLRNGASLRTVQELMRHSSVATTQIYTEVGADDLRRAVATLHPRL